jgi:hypothetical protein
MQPSSACCGERWSASQAQSGELLLLLLLLGLLGAVAEQHRYE